MKYSPHAVYYREPCPPGKSLVDHWMEELLKMLTEDPHVFNGMVAPNGGLLPGPYQSVCTCGWTSPKTRFYKKAKKWHDRHQWIEEG